MPRSPLLALALLGTAAARAERPPGHGFEVERYTVSLRPDLSSTAMAGSEEITVRVTADQVTRLAFTSNALRITGADLEGAPVAVSTAADGLIFTLPSPVLQGAEVTLRFDFDGTPARGVTAAAGGLYTSYFACDWMVCLQDSPGDKAHLALDLWLPDGVESQSIGRALPVERASDGLVLHRWRSTRATSPYLYAFAAGRFPRRAMDAGPGELVYLDGTGARADLDELFAEAPAIAAFFSEKAGLPLPDGRYVQLLVAGREAQEAASFSLIGRDELNGESADPSSGWVIAHEMAHQWWGNLVTCDSWREFWLNEGLATFLVAAWKEHRFGDAAYRAELAVADRRLARARALGFDKPLAWAGTYPSLGTRRAVQYSKGALFLAALRERIGDDAFWSGLRSYTRRHAGGTVVSHDLQVALEEASGRDLSRTFREWVYGPQ